MANIDIILETGLINDYGVFNLNKKQLENLNVDIVTDGNQFVESEEAKYQHGGESNFKDHEGIKPIDLEEDKKATWDQYGTILNDELKKYIEIPENSGTAKEELWENYKNYINQFEVKFDSKNTNTKNSGNSGNTKEIKYISYNNKEATSKSIQTYKLDKDDENNKISIQTNIIHFSKYYSIYELTFSNQKVLCPLLYNKNDLNTYNIQILDDSPYLSYLTSLKFYRHKKNGHRKERLFVELFEISKFVTPEGAQGVQEKYCFKYKENSGTKIIDYDDETDGGHQWSQFKTNPEDRPTFESMSGNWEKIPPGFHIIGFSNITNGYYFNDKNEQNPVDDKIKFPLEWQKNFGDKQYNYSLHRNQTEGGILKDPNDTNFTKEYAFLGLMYKSDKNGNWHIFNTYFPTLIDNRDSTYNISQRIKMYTDNGPTQFAYPTTIGLILSSILTSIYIYKDENSKNIKYISDIVFLERHSTLYTKDIVYKLYKNNSTTSDNDLLLFRGYEYSEYLKSLNKYLNIQEESDDTIKDNNIKAVIKSCIKNVPLQFKLEYLQPELSNVNNQNVISVQKITGEEITCASDIVEPNELYYLDDNNSINYLNSSFKIKWLKSLKLDENTNTLVGKLDSSKEDTSNSLIKNMFNYQGGRLGFNTNEVISSRESYYSIVTYNTSAFGNALHDILINDVLLPAARIL